MQAGDIKLWWNGKCNQPVVLVEKLNKGWLIRLSNGLVVGPVEELENSLR